MKKCILLAMVSLLFMSAPGIDAAKLKGAQIVGKAVDAEGIVSVKPVNADRWSSVESGTVFLPGDWVRTDPRGGNAVRIKFAGGGELTLGPGALAELPSAGNVTLIRGDAEARGTAGRVVRVNDRDVKADATAVFRKEEGKDKPLQPLDKDPAWLKYFKGAQTTESMGSLLANVDGRNVPLTIGYHKVTVDIRDQIARTTIEESFVNHTSGTLEGVFYFPLPSDASISGFGMWIGDTLVEADVVEKQRAREIYETILREKRDPGLLEWTGGNLFKARVFPIFGQSEKRIKLTYTQVLPMRGGKYRYSYALQSEMLKQNPLKELAIKVNISSDLPLAEVFSSTHACRVRTTDNAASVEFDAKEYTPVSDFEVEITAKPGSPALTMIPHRRAEDGYFLLALAPPDEAGDRDREVLPEGKPLEILILADTSGSMDRSQRKNQAAFVAALLSLLGEKDTFNIATSDVETKWLFEKPVSVTEANAGKARAALEGRRSLGWTDLDRAFAAALSQGGESRHIVYVGDGIVTSGDGDAVAMAKRLKRLCDGKPGTFHSIATGSAFEASVLKAIASLGGGSFRRIEGTDTPQKIAFGLLSEIAQPAIRDLKVEFKGFRAARVFPEELPNLPAGRQQILVGRYLPKDGANVKGEVVVSGVRDGKPVKFTTAVSFANDDKGNSFIPRLWARYYLDFLLDQGQSQEVKDEIIALSEEYQIMTPYTSFLVLESDADRERFQVKRRFQMRDGEKFFAEGRDKADYALAQKQMKLAGQWRLGLRKQALNGIATLRRNSYAFLNQHYDSYEPVDGTGALRGYGGGGAGKGGRYKKDAMPGSSFDEKDEGIEGIKEESAPEEKAAAPADHEGDGGETKNTPGEVAGDEDRGDQPATADKLLAETPRLLEPVAGPMPSTPAPVVFSDPGAYEQRAGGKRASRYMGWYEEGKPADDLYMREALPPYLQLFSGLFPQVPAPQHPPKVKSRWPDEARKLSDALLRTNQIAALKGGLAVKQNTFAPVGTSKKMEVSSESYHLVSTNGWVFRFAGPAIQTTLQWYDKAERGVWSRGFNLGTARKSEPGDFDLRFILPGDYWVTPLALTDAAYTPTVEKLGDDKVLLKLTHASSPGYESRLLIDTNRKVVLKVEHFSNGALTSSTVYGDFVKTGDAWWATRVENRDKDNGVVGLTTRTLEALDAKAFAKRVALEKDAMSRAVLLRMPVPDVTAAKQAILDKKPTLDAQLVLINHFGASGQWDKALPHLEQMEKLAGDKPGMWWVRSFVFSMSRQHAELRERTLARAKELARDAGRREKDASFDGDLYFLAQYLYNTAGNVLQRNEQFELLDLLKPVYERKGTPLSTVIWWKTMRIACLANIGKSAEALAAQKDLAELCPGDYSVQYAYITALYQRGYREKAYEWLKKEMAAPHWQQQERDWFRINYLGLIEQEGRFQEATKLMETWFAGKQPDTQDLCARYLSYLVRSDRDKEAAGLIKKWQEEGLSVAPKKQLDAADQAVLARLVSSISGVFGNIHNLNRYYNQGQVEEQWHAPLEKVVMAFAESVNSHVADMIMNDYRFHQTDVCRKLRKHFTGVLRSRIGVGPGGNTNDMLRAQDIQRFVGWAMANDPAVEKDVWKEIATAIEKRWEATSDRSMRQQLAWPLKNILGHRLGQTEYLAFLHKQWRSATKEEKPGFASELFQCLLNQPWTEEYEQEAFRLLREEMFPFVVVPLEIEECDEEGERVENTATHTAADATAEARLAQQVYALHQLTDRMIPARHAALMKAVEHPEKLSRTELAGLQKVNLKKAQEGYAACLKKEAAGLASQNKALSEWFGVERLCIEVKLGRDAREIAGEAWEGAGANPPGKADQVSRLDSVLLDRRLAILEYLATRKKADPELVKRLLAYMEKGIAGDPESNYWPERQWQLLVATDDVAGMERVLRKRIKPGKAGSAPRVMLAKLYAEMGRLDDAIKEFEAIEAADELTADQYRTLADWYMARNNKEKYQRAKLRLLEVEQEHVLVNRLQQMLQPWSRQQGEMPTGLDPETIPIFTALFKKTAQPGNYVSLLFSYYTYTHDFRLLECVAEGMTGHTPQQIYPMLEGMNALMNEVRDEATADTLMEQMAKVEGRAKTTVDRRALRFLEMQVKRRASEVLNRPEQWTPSALAAMQKCFTGEWAAGERPLMARLLSRLGAISQKPLADEQLRQLGILHQEEKDTAFRFEIAMYHAETLWCYEKRAEAVDVLEAALNEFRDASGGKLPASANGKLQTLVSYLENMRHFSRAEKILLSELGRPETLEQERWLRDSLLDLYVYTLENKGEVSLGSGETLYKAVEKKCLVLLDTGDINWRNAFIGRLCNLYRVAHRVGIGRVAEDVRRFAWKEVPAILASTGTDYQSVVGNVAATLHNVAGPRNGLHFLIERIENEPARLKWNNQDGWSMFGGSLAEWRRQAGALGDLEPRLLKIVLRELKAALEIRNHRSNAMYWRHNSDFWQEKASDFARVAEEVLEARQSSCAAVKFIAEYLWSGLDLRARAVEILFAAHRKGILDEGGESTLVSFLQSLNRHEEAAVLLKDLVKSRPETLGYRLQLLYAYSHLGRKAELTALLKDTDEFFHRDNRWNEGVLSQMARACLSCRLHEEAAAYYEELIPLHKRSNPQRMAGNGTLSQYYQEQSQVYSALGKTDKAVEAASGAIVVWAADLNSRNAAIQSLLQVLRQAKDLPAYAERLDKQLAESGMENPILRKAMGQMFLEQGKNADAAAQLKKAIAVQPNDKETHEALVRALEGVGDREGLAGQLLDWSELSRRDIAIFRKLADCFVAMKNEEDAERARTAIVEALPSETESHGMLAEIREGQGRWEDAETQWRQVSVIRALEPTGLLKLAPVQVRLKHFDGARETLKKLRGTKWAARFGDLNAPIRALEEQLEKEVKGDR